jgi:hypothetical protein
LEFKIAAFLLKLVLIETSGKEIAGPPITKATRLSYKTEDLKPVFQEMQLKPAGEVAVSFKLQQFLDP